MKYVELKERKHQNKQTSNNVSNDCYCRSTVQNLKILNSWQYQAKKIENTHIRESGKYSAFSVADKLKWGSAQRL